MRSRFQRDTGWASPALGLVSMAEPYLEVVGSPRAAADGEEVGHVVTEAAIVGVFHDCHQLQGRSQLLVGTRLYRNQNEKESPRLREWGSPITEKIGGPFRFSAQAKCA